MPLSRIGKKPFGIKTHRIIDSAGAQGDAERQPRMIQHPAQPAAIDGDHPFEETLAGSRESVLLTQRFVA